MQWVNLLSHNTLSRYLQIRGIVSLKSMAICFLTLFFQALSSLCDIDPTVEKKQKKKKKKKTKKLSNNEQLKHKCVFFHL